MAVSGTTIFDLDMLEIIEEAYEQAGIEARTGYDMRSARRSLDLLFIEWGNKGYNLWTVTEYTLPLDIGVGSYQLGPELIDLVEFNVRDTYRDENRGGILRRVPLAVHAGRNGPTQRGRPSQIYIDRQRTGPVLHLWPLPDQVNYTLQYWALRRINDTGNFTNTIDAPTRFLPSLIAGLAHQLAIKKNPSMADALERRAERLWGEATDEDRDRSDYFVFPELDHR